MEKQETRNEVSSSASAYTRGEIPDQLRPSISVEGAMKGLPRDEPISAATFARAILDTSGHIKEYVGGMFLSISLNDTEIRQPVDGWLAKITTLFDPGRMMELEKTGRPPVLNGRLAIIGLCLLDRQFRRQLEEPKVFEALVRETKPPIDEILSEAGVDAYITPESVSTWGDDPIALPAEDRLGRVPFARYLAIRLAAFSQQEGAFVMHLYAPWGAGKTTLLRFLHQILEPRKAKKVCYKKIVDEIDNVPNGKWLVVEFNAWQHQHIEPPWWSLMDRVYLDTRKKLKLWNRFREWIWRVNFRNIIPIFVGLLLVWIVVLLWPWLVHNLIAPLQKEDQPLVQIIIGSGTLVKNLGEIIAFIATIWGIIQAINQPLFLSTAKAAQDYKDRIHDPMNEIKGRFNTLIHRLKPYRVVVIIDDLDRCHSNYTVELLEGIQTLFRDVPVIFIVAADRCWLNACYEQVYEKLKSQISKPGKSLGDLFLEKAFQFSTPLPGILEELKIQYWDYILQLKPAEQIVQWDDALKNARNLLSQAKSDGAIERKVDASRSQNFIERRSIREAAVERLAVPGVVERIEHSLQKYIDLLEPNPRTMKRLANAFSANLALKYLSEGDINRQQLVLWTILSLRWPHLAEELIEYPAAVNDLASGNFNNLSEDWKKLPSDERDEIIEVIHGLPGDSALSADTIKKCKLMQA